MRRPSPPVYGTGWIISTTTWTWQTSTFWQLMRWEWHVHPLITIGQLTFFSLQWRMKKYLLRTYPYKTRKVNIVHVSCPQVAILQTFRGRILGLNPDKSWKSFRSWTLAHFFEVRYPLPTKFFPLDRWRSCIHFLNFPFRSSLKRSSLNQWFAERKRAESLIALYYKIMCLKCI